jgi:hypothetical protein
MLELDDKMLELQQKEDQRLAERKTRMLGPKVGVDGFRKNLTGISRELIFREECTDF